MDHLIIAWYGWLSSQTQGAVFGLQGVADGLALPVASAVVFGLVGATSPCQLTTTWAPSPTWRRTRSRSRR